jgi:hypothetical protein
MSVSLVSPLISLQNEFRKEFNFTSYFDLKKSKIWLFDFFTWLIRFRSTPKKVNFTSYFECMLAIMLIRARVCVALSLIANLMNRFITLMRFTRL